METMEVVEVRFAGGRNYSPIFPSDAMWKREGNQVITYAERWPDQYRAFKEGNPQEANGTPLEMLRNFGITPEQISLCRTLRIYSIEALDKLEGQPVKTLGMHANRLKDAARQYIADAATRVSGHSEIEMLRAELAALKASMVPAQDSTPTEIADAIQGAAYPDMTDSDIKDEIERLTQARPRGNPSRTTLENMLSQALAA
jgi:hypothetical protein